MVSPLLSQFHQNSSNSKTVHLPSPFYSSIHPHSHTLKLIIHWYSYAYVYSNAPLATFWLQLPISPILSSVPSFLPKVPLHLMVTARFSIPSFSFNPQTPCLWFLWLARVEPTIYYIKHTDQQEPSQILFSLQNSTGTSNSQKSFDQIMLHVWM